MPMKTQTLSIYFAKRAMEKKAVERLQKLAKKRDRNVNYLVVEAIVQYLEREKAST